MTTRPLFRRAVGHHPAVLQFPRRETPALHLRVADAITAVAGSMPFVYLHAVVFAVWMVFLERNPWPALTLVVSLEAIFLSTFVLIGQNRQSAFQQAKADHEFQVEEQELDENTQLTREIHRLTMELHAMQVEARTVSGAPAIVGPYRRPVDDGR